MFVRTEAISFKEFMKRGDSKKNDFFTQQVPEGVKKGKIKKVLIISTGFALALVIPETGLAATEFSPDVDRALEKLQVFCLQIAGGVAGLTLSVCGIYRMVGMSEKAKAWTKEIIKGLIQVLTAPTVVAIIIMVVRGLIKGLPGYTPF